MLINGISLGIFGQLHPIVARKFNLSSELYLFEFNLDVMKEQIKATKLATYTEYSLYPKIMKDLSFIVKQTVSFQDIQNLLFLNGTKYLSEVNLLDEYKGKSIPVDQISLCLQLVFQSNEKTLQKKDVETIMNQLQTLLITHFDITIRV